VSFKDDIVEALRSVKRDFSRDQEPKQDQEEADKSEQLASDTPSEDVSATQEDPMPTQEKEFDFDNYIQADATPGENSGDSDSADVSSNAESGSSSFENNDAGSALISGGSGNYGGGHDYMDFDDNGVYDDTKTIISKNTIIRGVLQTDDSIRLLGQVMGDIECRANIVVAGKIRGNTTASNAYIYDAQVDGDVRCDDIVTVSSDAWVLGNIRAQQAEIDGKVKGNMEIRHMVTIGAQSSVLGDISTDELEIKRGAFVNGHIMMFSPSRDVIDRFDSFED